MDTDVAPVDDPEGLAEYRRSDLDVRLELPPGPPLERLAGAWFEAVAGGELPAVRAAGRALLEHLAGFYGAPTPRLRVLGARPEVVEEGSPAELHGDYRDDPPAVRVWMRTAVHRRVVRPRTLLCTLLHELGHHLDVAAFALPESFHTRGFFLRVDALYHLALGTPPAERPGLAWRLVRGAEGPWWRFDWRALRRPGPPPDRAARARDWARLGR